MISLTKAVAGPLLAIVLTVAACVGGGGGGDSTPVATQIATPRAGQETPKSSGEPTVKPELTEIFLEVAVYDDSASNPLIFGPTGTGGEDNRIELWADGYGAWYPDLSSKADLSTMGVFPVGEEHDLLIYPGGRNGTEIRAPFSMNGNISPSRIVVRVSDTAVRVSGVAVAGFAQEFER